MKMSKPALILLALAIATPAVLAQGGKPGGIRATPKGKLTVINDTPWAVTVTMGEKELGQVPAKGRQEYTELPGGSKFLMTSSAAGDRRWGPKQVYITEAGVEYKVSESATTGFKIVNYTKEDLIVLLSDQPTGKAPKDGTAVFAEMKPGTVKVAARSASGKLAYSPRYIDVKEGQLAEWKIGTPPAGATAPSTGTAPATGSAPATQPTKP